jgi:hypothetical protein
MRIRFGLAAALLCLASPGFAPAGLVRVPQDYPLIQQACDVALSGDTILLGALNDTMYVEDVFLSGKTLIIKSESGPLRTQLRRRLIFYSSGPGDTTKVLGIRWKTGSFTPALQFQEGHYVVDQCVFDSSNHCTYPYQPVYTVNVGPNADAQITRCTFVSQQRAVKSDPGTPLRRSNVRVSSCIFVGSCDYALFPNGGYLSAAFCCFWRNADDADSSVDWGMGNIPFDPMLRRPNLSLQSGSPCIDAGDPDLPLDPDGSRADIGAYIPVRTAGTLYVSTGGDDGSGTGTFSQPFRTVSVAYLCSAPEDTIVLMPGTYREHLKLDYNSVLLTSLGGADVTRIEAAAGRPILEFRTGFANRSTISHLSFVNAQSTCHVWVGRPADPRFEYCTVAGHVTPVGGGLFISSDGVAVHGCRFSDNSSSGAGGGLYAVAADGLTVDSCVFEGNSSSGAGSAMLISNCRNATITRNLVFDNTNDYNNTGGAVVLAGTRQAVVRNNTVCNNSNLDFDALGGGIVVTQCTTVYLQNNLVSFNQGRYGIAVISGPVGVYNEYNNVYGHWSSGIYGVTPGPGFMEADPLVDPNYRLTKDSPCIDAGDPAMPVPPGGGDRIDIGAFEYQHPIAVTDSEGGYLPDRLGLERNVPNPFNSSTQISYTLPRSTHADLTIHDMLGRLVVTLVDEVQAAGRHVVTWDGRNRHGQDVGSGVYVYCLRAGGDSDTRRLLLLK